jgi:hypothetical protein
VRLVAFAFVLCVACGGQVTAESDASTMKDASTMPTGPEGTGDASPAAFDDPPRVRDAVDLAGFNLNASVRIEADDDLGREKVRVMILHQLLARRPSLRGRSGADGTLQLLL